MVQICWGSILELGSTCQRTLEAQSASAGKVIILKQLGFSEFLLRGDVLWVHIWVVFNPTLRKCKASDLSFWVEMVPQHVYKKKKKKLVDFLDFSLQKKKKTLFLTKCWTVKVQFGKLFFIRKSSITLRLCIWFRFSTTLSCYLFYITYFQAIQLFWKRLGPH